MAWGRDRPSCEEDVAEALLPRAAEGRAEPPSPSTDPGPLRRARIRLLAFMCVASPAFGGATFGWGPMQLVLEENGNYGHLCESDEEAGGATTAPCPEQTSSLLLVSTVTSFLFVVAPLWGALVDRRGPCYGIFVSSILVWTGLSVLAVSSFFAGTRGVDHLLFLSFACLMSVSTLSNILFVHVGLVFEDPQSTQRVISALNTLFDAGALTYLVLYQISLAVPSSVPNATGWVFMGYLGLSIIVYGGATWSWRRLLKEEEKSSGGACGDGQTRRNTLRQSTRELLMESGRLSVLMYGGAAMSWRNSLGEEEEASMQEVGDERYEDALSPSTPDTKMGDAK